MVGVQLAGAAFFSAVILPQANAILSNLELNASQQIVIEANISESIFRWPLTRFGLSQLYSTYHAGLDLTDPKGTPIYPITDGWIAWTNNSSFGYGKHVLVEHNNGITSLYAHLSKVNVKAGDTVTKEQSLGEVGATGWATGNHLHLEIYQDNKPINPIEVLPAITIPATPTPPPTTNNNLSLQP